MKRLKVLLVFIFLLIGTLTVLALSSEKYHETSIATKCLRYIGPQPTDEFEILETENWTPFFPSPLSLCSGGAYLCVLCYDDSNTSPDEARDALSAYYEEYGTFPSHGVWYLSPKGKWIIVYKKEI